MATERLNGSGRKSKSKEAGPGHNLSEMRKLMGPFFERMDTLQTEMDSTMADFRLDFKALYAEASDNTGIARKLIRSEFRRYLARRREIQAEKELQASEREQIELVRAALEGTPFGQYVEGELAKMTAAEKKAAKDAEKKAQEGASADA